MRTGKRPPGDAVRTYAGLTGEVARRLRRNDMTASHTHPTSTANQVLRIPIGSTMPPKNPGTTARP